MDDNNHLEAAVVGVAVCGGEQRVRAVDPGEDGHEPDTQPHQPGQPDHAASPPHPWHRCGGHAIQYGGLPPIMRGPI